MMILIFLTPLLIMSVPTQNTIGAAWIETAISSFQTPESDSSRPMAIPSNKLWTLRAITTRKLLMFFNILSLLSDLALLLLESDSVSELEVEVPDTVYTLAAWLWVGEGEQQALQS